MTLQMRVHGIECDHYQKEMYRVQFSGLEEGGVSTLFIRVPLEALVPYGLGTVHTVTIGAGYEACRPIEGG